MAVRWRTGCGFPLEIFDAVRAVFPADKPAWDAHFGDRLGRRRLGRRGSVALARELKALGCDFMDVSTGGLDGRQKIPLSAGYQVPFGEQVRKATGIKTMSVGLIANARQAEDIIASGKADFVVLGRGIMYDPRWAWHAAEELGAETAYAPKMMACHPKLRPQLFPNRAVPAQ